MLAPAVEAPDDVRAWRYHGTWEAVRRAIGWHEQLERILVRNGWPDIQALWAAHGGPEWDPWGLAAVLEETPAAAIASRFETRLHHVLRPGAALWVWVATPEIGTWPRLADLSAPVALDRVLRTLVPPDPVPDRPHFWNAWAEWVNDVPPDPDSPLDSLYPAPLLRTWIRALDTTDVAEPPAVHGDQLTLWDWI